MDHSWRARHPIQQICPLCSNFHFPFCTHPRYFTPPPPPPYSDEFFHPHHHLPPQPPLPPYPSQPPLPPYPSQPPLPPYPPPPPPQSQIPPPPWEAPPNSNFVDYAQTKRIRLNDNSSPEAERRLKLIRDHGAAATTDNPALDRNYNLDSAQFAPGGGFSQEAINTLPKRKFEESKVYHRPHFGHMQTDYMVNYNSFELDRRDRGFEDKSYPQQRPNFLNELLGQPNVELRPPYFSRPPPLPNSPPPPRPVEFQFSGRASSSAPGPSSLFPVAVGSASSGQSPCTVSQTSTSASMHYSSNAYECASREIQTHKLSSNIHVGAKDVFALRNPSPDKAKIIDASLILKDPHRSNRPDHIVVILRGLPGSGKSYLAKFLRDLEVENGGNAPRIHSMDDYFMTEVVKAEENENSGSGRRKKQAVKTVVEYCYEPEMEEAYRSSMLKAFKKTLDEGLFSFVIVDDRNLRIADFAQFWATAKRSGYEVYLLEATYKDPAGCAARNVHGFTLADVQKMANQWEETPSLYMKLDIKSLLHGDDLEENGIQEVDMDTEDNNVGESPGQEDAKFEKVSRLSGDALNSEYRSAGDDLPNELVKELGKSKWSTDLDEDNVHETEVTAKRSATPINLSKPFRKKGKPVRWADQVGKIGFSISAGKSTNISLIIGPGSGYNMKSNPLPDEEKLNQRSGQPRGKNAFQQRLRAERESFRAVFDKKRQRVGVLSLNDE